MAHLDTVLTWTSRSSASSLALVSGAGRNEPGFQPSPGGLSVPGAVPLAGMGRAFGPGGGSGISLLGCGSLKGVVRLWPRGKDGVLEVGCLEFDGGGGGSRSGAFRRPYGTRGFGWGYPAMNCRATLGRPDGTGSDGWRGVRAMMDDTRRCRVRRQAVAMCREASLGDPKRRFVCLRQSFRPAVQDWA